MNAPQDHDRMLLEGGGTPAVLTARKLEITERFEQRIRSILPAANAQPSPIITDSLPSFLTGLALALSENDSRQFASEHSNIAIAHGIERARFADYTLSAVIREYQVLREAIVDVLMAEASPSMRELAIVHRSIDEAVRDAASAFADVQESTREQFISTLTHDFRGPLAAAHNYVELLRRTTEAKDRERFAGRALENLQRMGRMIDGLLDARRVSAAKGLPVDWSTCDLAQVTRDVLEDLALGEGDRFTLDIGQPVQVIAGCELLRQAIHNLAENAVKYGASEVPITVRIIEVLDRVHLSVHNLGPPIAQSDLPALFKPYQRADSAKQSGKGGWGLGVAMVQSVAEAHGGAVTVESTAEGGTTFTLDILKDARLVRANAAV